MKERVLEWLASKASAYLIWHHEREIAQARATNPECPDCSMPEPFCCCDERYNAPDVGWNW